MYKILISTALTVICLFANAQTITVDGINYKILGSDRVAVGKNPTSTSTISIPLSVDYNGKTYNVTEIGDSAFYLNTNIEIISGGTFISKIGKYAFFGAIKLNNFSTKSSYYSVSDYAFAYCSNLTSIDISSAHSIGNYAFYACDGLQSIKFSASTVGNFAFANCTSLKDITLGWAQPLPVPNDAFQNVDKTKINLLVIRSTVSLFLSDSQWNTFVVYSPQPFFINNVEYIRTSKNTAKVSNAKFVSGQVIIPSTIVDFNTNLTVNGMDDNAFQGNGITSVILPNTITKLGANLFGGNLTYVSLPDSVKEIPANTFYGCAYLTSIKFPSALKSIGKNAFAYTGFTTINLPNTITFIDSGAFDGTYNLTSIYVNWSNPIAINGAVFQEWSQSGIKLYVPNNKVATYKKANFWKNFDIVNNYNFTFNGLNFKFLNNNNSVAVTRNPGVTGKVTIPSTIVYEGQTYKVTSIADSAFYGCIGLTSVTFSNKTITYARQLGIDTLSSLKNIGKHAFENCSALTYIEIPDSVLSIGDSAFAYCTGLIAMKVNWINPLIIKNTVFEGTSISTVDLLVPTASLSSYQSTAVWENFRFESILEIENNQNENFVQIYPNPFSGQVSIKLDTQESDVVLEILNSQGSVVFSKAIYLTEEKIDLSSLQYGYYTFRLNSKKYNHLFKMVKI